MRIRQSIKVKGLIRAIPFKTPVSDKRKARKLRRKIGKGMAESLKNLPAPEPLYERLHEEVKLGRLDIGYATSDGLKDELPVWYKEIKNAKSEQKSSLRT